MGPIHEPGVGVSQDVSAIFTGEEQNAIQQRLVVVDQDHLTVTRSVFIWQSNQDVFDCGWPFRRPPFSDVLMRRTFIFRKSIMPAATATYIYKIFCRANQIPIIEQ